MNFSTNLKYLCFSIILFFVINALTFQSQPIENDEFLLARLSSHISLIGSGTLQDPSVYFPENCQSCLVEPSLPNKDTNACFWSHEIPRLSCQLREVPFTLIINEREGGLEELPVTLLSRVVGPLDAVKIMKLLLKLGVLLINFGLLLLFKLPPEIIILTSLSPMFHGMGQLSVGVMEAIFASWLGLYLILQNGKKSFFLASLCFLFAAYVWLTFVFNVIPAVILLLFFKKDRRRAVKLILVLGIFLLARISLNYLNPYLIYDMTRTMIEKKIWLKKGEYFFWLARDYIRLYSFSSDWVNLTYPKNKISIILEILEAGVLIIVALSLCRSLGRSQTKITRNLVAFFLACSFPFFVFGHNTLPTYLPRITHLTFLVVIAIYLGAMDCAKKIAESRFSKLALLPILWLWSTALFSCSEWVYAYSKAGPEMKMSIEYVTRLGHFLESRQAYRPIIIDERSARGALDFLSNEVIRPLYIDYYYKEHSNEKSDPMDAILFPWSKLGKGTLLQKSYDDHEWPGLIIDRERLEQFANKNDIQINKIDFFNYKENKGYWIIDFINKKRKDISR